jgi:hypothetical protein
MSDSFDLQRFVDAQAAIYPRVVEGRQNLPLLETGALDAPPFCTINYAAILHYRIAVDYRLRSG